MIMGKGFCKKIRLSGMPLNKRFLDYNSEHNVDDICPSKVASRYNAIGRLANKEN